MNNLPPLPAYLDQRRECIIAAKGFAGKVTFNTDHWRNYLPTEVELANLLDEYVDGIGRDDLRHLSEQAATSAITYRRLLLAAMLWGYGPIRYGPSRVGKMLGGDAELINVLLSETAQLVRDGNHAEAVRQLHLPQLGVSFATKYLYAVGLGYELHPGPLVLDLRVAAALRQLANEGGFDVTRFATVRGRAILRSGSAYYRYTQLLDAWGDAMGCPADKVEYFLFKLGKKRKRHEAEGNAPCA